jgi:predicted GIY-YIG superfamily endonuclease
VAKTRHVVYLIHFARKFKHARHYVGFTSNLKARIARHKDGTGSALMRAVTKAGIPWRVVRQWPVMSHADGKLAAREEHRVKTSAPSKALCPVCSK